LLFKFPPEKIVFDSPCKTKKELKYCLKKGIFINADNFEEIERIKNIKKNYFDSQKKLFTSKIGLRINPQIKGFKILETSTATKTAKFGIPFKENGVREKIEKEVKENDFIKGLHVLKNKKKFN
jgi:diaminopimelate decarboxylase